MKQALTFAVVALLALTASAQECPNGACVARPQATPAVQPADKPAVQAATCACGEACACRPRPKPRRERAGQGKDKADSPKARGQNRDRRPERRWRPAGTPAEQAARLREHAKRLQQLADDIESGKAQPPPRAPRPAREKAEAAE